MRIQRRGELYSFLGITLGSFIMAVALNGFLLNHDLVIGVGGLSRILEKWLGIPREHAYWCMSTAILLSGGLLREEKLKGDFIFRSFTGIMWLSFVFLPLTKRLTAFRLPLPGPENIFALPVAAAVGSVLLGLGVGVVMRAGGSTCGLDLIARLLEKEKGIEKPCTMRVIDSLILAAGIAAFIGKDVFSPSSLPSVLMYIGSSLILIYLLPKAAEFAEGFA